MAPFWIQPLKIRPCFWCQFSRGYHHPKNWRSVSKAFLCSLWTCHLAKVTAVYVPPRSHLVHLNAKNWALNFRELHSCTFLLILKLWCQGGAPRSMSFLKKKFSIFFFSFQVHFFLKWRQRSELCVLWHLYSCTNDCIVYFHMQIMFVWFNCNHL